MMSLDLAAVIDFGLGAVAILCLLPPLILSWWRNRAAESRGGDSTRPQPEASD